jgi:hypothetical protein
MSVTSTLFDWRTLVANNKPSQASDIQLARLEALPQLTTDLEKWSNQYKLLTQRVGPSAYTGCVITATPFSYQRALLFAKYILWVYSLDNYIDKFDYSQFDLTNSKNWLNYLDGQLSCIVKPLYQLGGLTFEQGYNYGLELNFNQTSEHQLLEPISFNLKESLQNLYQDLQASWQYTHQHELHSLQKLNFSLTNFTHYFAKMVGAMRWEMIQNFNYWETLDSNRLPNVEKYLNQSKFSIGLCPGGAIVAGYEIDPEAAAQLCNMAMETSAKIVRLANDLCSNYWSELEERKVNSITIALAQLNFAPLGLYQEGSLEVKQAKEIVRARLEVELERFVQQIKAIPDIPFLHWMRVQLAFALAMYEKGDFVEPD